MSQPWQISYPPADAGEKPYGGLHVQAPENLIDPSFSPSFNNFLLRNRELRSRPAFRQYLPGPDGNNPVLGCGSFLSANALWHTFTFTNRGLFQLQPNHQQIVKDGGNPWQFLAGGSLNAGVRVAWQSFANILYYTNGPHLGSWDGTTTAPVVDVATLAAPATVIGSFFLGELNNHLLMAYTFETVSGATVQFPSRIRWSQNGVPNVWDPTVNINAGFNDFLDVPDIITGLMLIGRVGYLFRQNGITEMAPTGRGLAPFQFNHLWASQHGIGNVYPFSIAQYGPVGAFISTEQIYKVSSYAFEPIGGMARDAIMQDLTLATGSPRAQVCKGYRMGYIYLTYKILIPIGSDTRIYLYSFEDNNWSRWTISGGVVIGDPNECWV